jgi:hypothetical protein
MNEKIKVMDNFHKSLVGFLDALSEMFPKEPHFIIARIAVKDRINVCDILEYFNKYVIPHKNLIKSRNKEIIVDKIFTIGQSEGVSIEKESVSSHIKLYDSMSEDDKNILWSWVELFVKLVDKYNEITK